MSNTISIMQGDTAPDHRALLEDDAGPVDLSGSTVTMKMKPVDGGVSSAALPCTVDSVAGVGWIRHVWVTGETSVPGVYWIEYLVVFANGKQETWPGDSGAKLKIQARKTG